MDHWKFDSDITNLVDNYRDYAGVSERHVDNSNVKPKDESERGVDFESNSGQTSKDGTEKVQTVDLEANRVHFQKRD